MNRALPQRPATEEDGLVRGEKIDRRRTVARAACGDIYAHAQLPSRIVYRRAYFTLEDYACIRDLFSILEDFSQSM